MRLFVTISVFITYARGQTAGFSEEIGWTSGTLDHQVNSCTFSAATFDNSLHSVPLMCPNSLLPDVVYSDVNSTCENYCQY